MVERYSKMFFTMIEPFGSWQSFVIFRVAAFPVARDNSNRCWRDPLESCRARPVVHKKKLLAVVELSTASLWSTKGMVKEH